MCFYLHNRCMFTYNSIFCMCVSHTLIATYNSIFNNNNYFRLHRSPPPWFPPDSLETPSKDDHTVDTDFSGTTLVSVCIRGTRLVLTNVGDSRITLGRRHSSLSRHGERGTGKGGGPWGRGTIVAQPLTEDHKPDTPTEVCTVVEL